MKAKLATVYSDEVETFKRSVSERVGVDYEAMTTIAPDDGIGVEIWITAVAKKAMAAVWFAEGWCSAREISRPKP